MIEHAFHQCLTVVKGAFDGERVHVRIGRGCHHTALHFGDTAVREQHNDVDLRTAAEGFDRCTAGVAGGRDRDRRALAPLAQHMVHQARNELHRQILEGERRAMEESSTNRFVPSCVSGTVAG